MTQSEYNFTLVGSPFFKKLKQTSVQYTELSQIINKF